MGWIGGREVGDAGLLMNASRVVALQACNRSPTKQNPLSRSPRLLRYSLGTPLGHSSGIFQLSSREDRMQNRDPSLPL